MATITCLSFPTCRKLNLSRQDVVREIERTEKESFARHEVFDFASELKKRNVELIVIVDDDGRPSPRGKVGVVAYMTIAHTKNANMVNLHKICVHESFRQRGIGKKLLIAQTEKLKKHGATNIQLWVDESNSPARMLYQKIGFKEVRRLGNYYTTDRAGVQMVMNLI